MGRLLDDLKDSGLERDTIVVYTSDQGFLLGAHGLYDKRFMYEESLRMPLLVRWPAAIRPGSEAKELVLDVDCAPTVLETAGATTTCSKWRPPASVPETVAVSVRPSGETS